MPSSAYGARCSHWPYLPKAPPRAASWLCTEEHSDRAEKPGLSRGGAGGGGAHALGWGTAAHSSGTGETQQDRQRENGPVSQSAWPDALTAPSTGPALLCAFSAVSRHPAERGPPQAEAWLAAVTAVVSRWEGAELGEGAQERAPQPSSGLKPPGRKCAEWAELSFTTSGINSSLLTEVRRAHSPKGRRTRKGHSPSPSSTTAWMTTGNMPRSRSKFN